MASTDIEQASLDILTVETAGIPFALPLTQTRKVLPLIAMGPIPRAHGCVAGMMNVGGENIPALDLAIRLHLGKRPAYTPMTSIVVVGPDAADADVSMQGRSSRDFALIVDKIGNVERLSLNALEEMPRISSDDLPFRGIVASRRMGKAFFLDLEFLLDLDKEYDQQISLQELHASFAATA